ncbi:branched-chain amino acid transport system substrate-binding protein [Ectothiorhodosinus mongolicus]|uniref:Branched-chain amino acid transport system substrate-binding protein n=1 Tax=Ectothiorhodosinus mongolicus TaxID=233100 RepID=A0A1R3VMY1_9GAMM|nr:ABC transporter substrate-binding protein [Ectothiorhodosinus mongolicus]ULX56416.1 ABC transporter substrate-binding protein [Ectothiorhodosinus mongolicus]SIT65941.1 branched-chain amino acid transport system substrate-binding protein [Ectothiorhodosinus mongolicus]
MPHSQRIIGGVLAGALLIAFAVLWLDSRAVIVGVDAPLTDYRLFDPTEMDALRLFKKENPRSRIAAVPGYYDFNIDSGRAAIEDMITAGARFIVTTQPSSTMVGSIDRFTDGEVLLINTSSTSLLMSDKDDYILRIMPDLAIEQNFIASVIRDMPGRRLLVVQDAGNAAYTDPAYEQFRLALHAPSPDQAASTEQTPSPNQAQNSWDITHVRMVYHDFDPTEYRDIIAQGYDALYLLGGDFQTATGTIMHYFHSNNPDARIILTPWSRSAEILKLSGDALAQTILVSHFPSRRDNPAIDSYLTRFEREFDYTPQFMAIKIRQALELVDAAFRQGHTTPAAVKSFLLQQTPHQTSLGSIHFNRYGDVQHGFYLLKDLERELR